MAFLQILSADLLALQNKKHSIMYFMHQVDNANQELKYNQNLNATG